MQQKGCVTNKYQLIVKAEGVKYQYAYKTSQDKKSQPKNVPNTKRPIT
jgi:hypothetical protein